MNISQWLGQRLSMKAKKSCLPLAMTALSLTWSARAHAFCTGFYANEEMWCYSPDWDLNQPMKVVVGSDPYDSNSHWIGWQNLTTDECGWEQIGWGNTGELGGWNDQQNQYVHIQDVLIRSNYGSDEIIIAGGWIYHCGYWLAPVVFNAPQSNAINVDGDEGNDSIYNGSNGNYSYLLGGAGDDYVSSWRADVYIDSDSGDDVIAVEGEQGGGFYWASDGNDYLWYFGSATQIMGCGDGVDGWIGPGTRPSDCEN